MRTTREAIKRAGGSFRIKLSATVAAAHEVGWLRSIKATPATIAKAEDRAAKAAFGARALLRAYGANVGTYQRGTWLSFGRVPSAS